MEYETEDEYDWDEAEAYLTTRSRSTPYPTTPKSKNRRNIHSESTRENTLRSNSIPIPPRTTFVENIGPEPMDDIINGPPESSHRKGKAKYSMKPAPIEEVTEFNIEQYIKDLPCGMSIGQAAKAVPTYRRGLQRILR